MHTLDRSAARAALRNLRLGGIGFAVLIALILMVSYRDIARIISGQGAF